MNNIASKELCKKCNHLWNDHLLKGHGERPTEGWMVCPVEGCTCYKTWSFDSTYVAPTPDDAGGSKVSK